MWKGVYVSLLEHFLWFYTKHNVHLSLETTRKWWRKHMLSKGISAFPPPIPELFLNSLQIKLRWKMMNPNTKVAGVFYSLEFTTKWKAYAFGVKIPMHFSRNFVATRWSTAPARKFTNSPYTRLKIDYLSLDCFAYLTPLKDRAFPVVPQSTRGIISKHRTTRSLKMLYL